MVIEKICSDGRISSVPGKPGRLGINFVTLAVFSDDRSANRAPQLRGTPNSHRYPLRPCTSLCEQSLRLLGECRDEFMPTRNTDRGSFHIGVPPEIRTSRPQRASKVKSAAIFSAYFLRHRSENAQRASASWASCAALWGLILLPIPLFSAILKS
jgi:hypothetical protein